MGVPSKLFQPEFDILLDPSSFPEFALQSAKFALRLKPVFQLLYVIPILIPPSCLILRQPIPTPLLIELELLFFCEFSSSSPNLSLNVPSLKYSSSLLIEILFCYEPLLLVD